MTQVEQVRAVQAKLGLTADGIAGPRTWAGIYGAIIGMAEAPPPAPVQVDDAGIDPRSSACIATLLPSVQQRAREFLRHVNAQLPDGFVARITSGTRTDAEQNALYAQGRTTGGPIVTHARAGYSNHNFGVAWDITIFHSGVPLDQSKLYATAGAIGKLLGLEWGGDWKSIDDEPHFQVRPAWSSGMSESDMLAEMRHRKEQGEEIA